MTKLDFYDRLAQVAQRPLTSVEIAHLDAICKPSLVTQKLMALDCLKDRNALLKGRIPEFISIEDVPRRVAEGGYGYWLYDRKTKTWIMGIAHGVHERLATILYRIITGITLKNADYAANYIQGQYGFYMSGAMFYNIAIKDKDCFLCEEEQIFDTIKGRTQWRGI